MIRRLCLILALSVFHPYLHAQSGTNALSNDEVDQLRDSANAPRARVLVYIKFLDDRSKAVEALFAHPRKPGREQDTHDLIEQFTSIANELDDNLDDYSKRHRDIRKVLPKLLDASDRWASELRSPPDNEAYNVSRKLSLQAISDLHEDATELIEQQKTWFAAHPPPKEDKNSPFEAPG
jgi:hypothetical protein